MDERGILCGYSFELLWIEIPGYGYSHASGV